jgi:hypothetical protein
MAGNGTWAATLVNLTKSVGYREGKNNANMFSRGLGRPAEFWCADFAEYQLMVSGVPRIGTSAYTPKVEAQYKKAGRLGTVPRIGAQFFLYSPSEGRVFHTGIVIGLLPGSRVRTIEGNTNDDGSNNGNGVYLRIRPAHRSADRVGIRSYGYPRYIPARRPSGRAPARPGVIRAIQKLLGEVMVDGDLGPKTQARFSAVRATCRAHPAAGQTWIVGLQRAAGMPAGTAPVWGPDTDVALRRLGFTI